MARRRYLPVTARDPVKSGSRHVVWVYPERTYRRPYPAIKSGDRTLARFRQRNSPRSFPYRIPPGVPRCRVVLFWLIRGEDNVSLALPCGICHAEREASPVRTVIRKCVMNTDVGVCTAPNGSCLLVYSGTG